MDNNNRENLPPPERGGFLNLLQEEDHEGGMNGQSNGNHDGAHGGAHAVFSNGYSNGHDQGNGHGHDNGHDNGHDHDHVNGNGHSLSNGNGNGLDVSHAEAINGQSHAELQVVPHHQLLVSDAQLAAHLPPLQNHHLVQPQPLMEGSILQAQLVDAQPHHLELQPFQPNNLPMPIITVTSLDSGPTSPQPGPSRTSRGQKRKCSGGVKASYKRDTNGKKKSPYTPSYMSRDEKCVVCDDLATGYHYRRMTCEGCKGFFRRTYQRNKQNSYTCKFSKNCVINKETRNACQYCRHKKCLVKGMCPDLVLDEIARRQKKRLIQLNRQKRAQNAKEEEQKEQMLDKENNIRVTITYNAYVFSMNLTMHQREEDLGNWDPIQRLTKMLDNCMERLGSFATQLPEFMKMSDADKCALLKGSFMDVLIVMSAEHYNPQTNQVRIGGFLVDLDKEREHYPVTYQLMEVLHRNIKLISKFLFNRESLSLLAQNGLFKINNIALEDPDAVDMIKGETLHLSFLYDGSKEKKCLQTRGMVAVVVAAQEVQTEFERLRMIKEGELPQTLLELIDKDLPAYSPFWLKCLETHSSFLDPSHDQQLELPLPFADVDNLQDVLP